MQLLIVIALEVIHVGVYAQNYLKQLKNPELSSRQNILRFPNGDILIGDSSFEGALKGDDAAIYLTRIDGCGSLVWSYKYVKNNLQLNFCDFAVNEEGEIFIYGTASDGSQASLFMLNVAEDGSEKRLQIFSSDSPSHSAYSMDLQGDQILMFGSILVTGAPRTGFLAVLDMQLNLQWAKKIVPFTFEGDAIFTRSGDILARSEALHYMFDGNGNLLWGQTFDRQLKPVPMGGPYKVAGGFLFQAYDSERAFFYKLNHEGQLLWQTVTFPSTSFSAAVQELPNGEWVAHYSHPVDNSNALAHLRFSSEGDLLQHQLLDTDLQMHIGSLDHSISEEGVVNVVGNRDALNALSVDRTEFLLQYTLPEAAAANCYDWQNIDDAEQNNVSLAFPEIAIDQLEFLALEESLVGGIEQIENDSFYVEICGNTLKPLIISIDTTLSCNEVWSVSLPSADFRWNDGFENSERLVDEPKTYIASNHDCADPQIYEYKLKQSGCDCEVILPNAFTPNGDGTNDVVEVFSGCDFLQMRTYIFDRWGNLVFRSDGSTQLWDGMIGADQAPTGIYIAKIDYEVRASQGGTKDGSAVQGVMLIR